MSLKMLKSTFTVGGMTGISRVFGLIRDVVIARYFGPGLGLDVFIVAFRIPNFLRRLFAEGGFQQAFVPVLTEYKEQREEEEVKALVDQTAATLGLILLAVTAVGVLISPILITIFAPNFINDVDKHTLASDLLKITFPYILFISLTAFAGSILNTYKQFAVPAFTPVLLNLSLIACAIWLSPYMQTPITALAWGVFIAGVVQLLFQFPFLIRLGKFPIPRLNRDKEGVRRIITLMLPILFAVSIVQINLLIDTMIASFLQTGSISWLYFSDRLVEFPLGVFGIALATVVLPNLSEKYSQGSTEGFSTMLDWALRLVFLIALPAAVGLAALSAPLLTTLFQYEEFTPLDVLMASQSLMAYAVGLPAFVLIKILSSGFFSRQDTKTPVKIGAIAMLANIVFNLILVFPLAHAGLALATSLSAFLQAYLLFRILKKEQVYRVKKDWSLFLLKVLIGISIMGTFVAYGAGQISDWFAWSLAQRLQNILLWVGAGIVIYLIVMTSLGIRWRDMTAPSS
ncbi:MAG: murein biosynthesis integral membrane protein MurJ [Pseudomonadota bacterium]